MLRYLVLVLVLSFVASPTVATDARSASEVVNFTTLSRSDVQYIAQGISEAVLREYTSNIAVVRVSDTESHRVVQDYIANQFARTNWIVERDIFRDDTPMGRKTFTNIIASYRPEAAKFLMIGAHYDSKYFKDFEFIGATDSAVPCAILIDMAKKLDPLLHLLSPDMGIKIVFFDGEEAFGEWTATDSLYGSRHLAQEWATPRADGATTLERISSFVLLDLIGFTNPKFASAYVSSDFAFDRLFNIEGRMKQQRLLASTSTAAKNMMFANTPARRHISDDHEPFVQRGVRCVHLIAVPFPAVWHTERDKISNIDWSATVDVAKVIQTFVHEYLGLRPSLATNDSQKSEL